jgi:hypothetical protein
MAPNDYDDVEDEDESGDEGVATVKKRRTKKWKGK